MIENGCGLRRSGSIDFGKMQFQVFEKAQSCGYQDEDRKREEMRRELYRIFERYGK